MWSEGRSKSMQESLSARVSSLKVVNDVLCKYASDIDLKDDLKLKEVKMAISHWTNAKRLSPEEASKLMDNYRVASVFTKLQVLQHVSKQAKIPFPLEFFLQSQPFLSDDFIVKEFGQEVLEAFRIESSVEASVDVSETLDKDNSPAIGATTITSTSPKDGSKKSPYRKLLYWGYENPEDKNFSWIKYIFRCIIDGFILAVVSLIFAKLYMNHKIIKSGSEVLKKLSSNNNADL